MNICCFFPYLVITGPYFSFELPPLLQSCSLLGLTAPRPSLLGLNLAHQSVPSFQNAQRQACDSNRWIWVTQGCWQAHGVSLEFLPHVLNVVCLHKMIQRQAERGRERDQVTWAPNSRYATKFQLSESRNSSFPPTLFSDLFKPFWIKSSYATKIILILKLS